MNSLFSLHRPPPPVPVPPAGPASAPARPVPEPLRVFRAPALPSFQPCWQEIPFTAHLGPRIREPV